MRDPRRLPKAHLHVHLESTIRPSTLRDLAAVHGVRVPQELSGGRHRFGGFADFLAQNELVRSCLRRPDDFRKVAYQLCADHAADGVAYVEVSFTAAAHGERLGELDMPLANVLAGLARGRAEFGIDYGVILDHSRRRSVTRAWRTLELALAYATDGVVAVGLAGDESYPGDPFVDVFDAARENGLHVVHHAGEAAGAASVRQALRDGRAERIGHGIRVLEDEDLVAEVRDLRIPLEVCPSSNVALGFASSFETHPLPRLREAGLQVTVNTDIPAMTGADLTGEYTRVRDAYAYDDTELAGLARNAVDASFAPPDVKRRLHAGIDGWLT
ncbi:MAG: adenosine deaminase [Streptosporangiales bacterium]|nr:adenosine deaminase [Streptosporangiales bacterium]